MFPCKIKHKKYPLVNDFYISIYANYFLNSNLYLFSYFENSRGLYAATFGTDTNALLTNFRLYRNTSDYHRRSIDTNALEIRCIRTFERIQTQCASRQNNAGTRSGWRKEYPKDAVNTTHAPPVTIDYLKILKISGSQMHHVSIDTVSR